MVEQSAHVLTLARQFLEYLRDNEPDFERAFYRFEAEPGRFGGNASVVSPSGIRLIGSIKNAEMLRDLGRTGRQLIMSLGQDTGVFVLTVRANCDFNIQYEWDDLTRWKITKLEGGTGLPEGLEQ